MPMLFSIDAQLLLRSLYDGSNMTNYQPMKADQMAQIGEATVQLASGKKIVLVDKDNINIATLRKDGMPGQYSLTILKADPV